MIIKTILVTAIIFILPFTAKASVVDFEDLNSNTFISGTGYAGLIWEYGLLGGAYQGNTGVWGTPYGDPYTAIGTRNVINHWGALSLGITFNSTVNVNGAFFSQQGDVGLSTTGVRVHGFLNGVETSVTGWFTDIDLTNSWFAMNLIDVDRIVIESQEVDFGAGWYGMDNFTFNEEISTDPVADIPYTAPPAIPIPASIWLFCSGIIALFGIAKRNTET